MRHDQSADCWRPSKRSWHTRTSQALGENAHRTWPRSGRGEDRVCHDKRVCVSRAEPKQVIRYSKLILHRLHVQCICFNGRWCISEKMRLPPFHRIAFVWWGNATVLWWLEVKTFPWCKMKSHALLPVILICLNRICARSNFALGASYVGLELCYHVCRCTNNGALKFGKLYSRTGKREL